MVSEHQFYVLTIVVIIVIFLFMMMGCFAVYRRVGVNPRGPPRSGVDYFTNSGTEGADTGWIDTLVPPESSLSFKCYRSLNHPGGPAAGTPLSSVESIKTGRDPIHIEQSFNWFNTQ